mgnify:FL=1
MLNVQSIRENLLNVTYFNSEIIELIATNNWLNIWVPKQYNGLGLTTSEGLKILQTVSKIDGSLGWFVTLCSGANYFSRNLYPSVAFEIFSNQKACFGGSGMIGGTAEKVKDHYIINGLWHYATGAPYLTHFTLNAQILENGQPLVDENNQPKILSFILDKAQVKLIPSWKSMGMVATSSHSFEVVNQTVHKDYSFIYNTFFSDDLVEKIPFHVFADLTLLVNYIGMAEHFLEKSLEIITFSVQQQLDVFLKRTTLELLNYAQQMEELLINNLTIEDILSEEIHQFGTNTVSTLTTYIIQIYPQLGIKASRSNEEINQIFRDFFTATQHRNFR